MDSVYGQGEVWQKLRTKNGDNILDNRNSSLHIHTVGYMEVD